MRWGRKELSRSNRNGRPGGENRWVSCSWPEPTLPPRTREGWGNLVRNLDSEGWASPPEVSARLRLLGCEVGRLTGLIQIAPRPPYLLASVAHTTRFSLCG